jgi:hypothetical protein
MKTKHLIPALAIVVTSIAFSSCKKDSLLNSPSEVSFALQTDNSVTTFTGAPAVSLTWTSGLANISSFKLEAKRNGVETEIKSKNLTNVDLFSLVPALATATIDSGTYKEIEVRVVLAKSTTSDLPLLLKGTFKNSSGVSVPVELDFNDDATIKAEVENVTIDSKTDIATTISMHLNKLLTNVSVSDLNSATLTNGTIVISSTSNASIYNKIKTNLLTCGESKGFERHEKSERHGD